MKNTVNFWELLAHLKPSTIQAIAQDLTDSEAWKGIDENERNALNASLEFYEGLTGEKLLLTSDN
jgi:hypothetical protein